eukprot:TRINITY_DN5427_c0_g1_i1.p1 TRINITY_DN5427_c0_g1~~TRINITY_DN5427_c0_g1_i1.p1  ORF type:complete len:765 (-),score=282.29 TRINITY_DN5427_c0_g1_i1:138-2432(-)
MQRALSLPNSHFSFSQSSSKRCSPRISTLTRSSLHASPILGSVRSFAAAVPPPAADYQDAPHNVHQKKIRNIGISAHIDSGKTTLTERVLFYTGRIGEIHEVKGKDGEGAKMDFMDLEREKGITIQSAATSCFWGDNRINIIDTPGHVDFTIEVERALRVLDGAVLVMCGVSGVQSQTITVDRQMKRYQVPRLVFINKLDRTGADHKRVLEQLRDKLKLNAAFVTIPIGLEDNLEGIVDCIDMVAKYGEGYNGQTIVTKPIPEHMLKQAKETRQKMLDMLMEGNNEMAEKFLENDFDYEKFSREDIKAAMRKSTIARTFTPVLCGSALKNKGVQAMLDAVIDYLPTPMDAVNKALDINKGEQEVQLVSDTKQPFVGLAFKLEEGRFGQLTYMRVYQGKISRGDTLTNVTTGKSVKVPRLCRMHAADKEDITEIGAGDICALFGVDCATGTSFTTGDVRYALTSMHVPEPVMSLAISTKKKDQGGNFSKALHRFQKEDPTFRVTQDPESNQTLISGMGELHLEIYVERMKREYNVEAVVGKPQVSYRETLGSTSHFDYLHKKQSGGAGQYAKIIGYLEPIDVETDKTNEFSNETVGQNIPPEYIPACEKGFMDSVNKGPLTGSPVTGVRMVLKDGAAHSVDSSELAFRICTRYAFTDAFKEADPKVLEPIMKVEVLVPSEFQGTVLGSVNKRKGQIQLSETGEEYATIIADVPLNNMFGYSTELRSLTQGKGEFTMEYKMHQPVMRDEMMRLMEEWKKKQAEARK